MRDESKSPFDYCTSESHGKSHLLKVVKRVVELVFVLLGTQNSNFRFPYRFLFEELT
jgi:hypothetical protein